MALSIGSDLAHSEIESDPAFILQIKSVCYRCSMDLRYVETLGYKHIEKYRRERKKISYRDA